ncbi:hypothetical protein Slala05_45390 [Streptomyces lavendulae subsp. lavendulae]|nr:hypothetical protein Slala05_45390 [Streptomyces lavendulae subsp. lavendulae]
MTAVDATGSQAASQMPLPPVLVRSHVPGRPFIWIDPTPRTADSRGHSWTYSSDEPLTPSYCLLCCTDYGDRATYRPCEEAGLLGAVNDERAEWIAANRVNPEDIR